MKLKGDIPYHNSSKDHKHQLKKTGTDSQEQSQRKPSLDNLSSRLQNNQHQSQMVLSFENYITDRDKELTNNETQIFKELASLNKEISLISKDEYNGRNNIAGSIEKNTVRMLCTDLKDEDYQFSYNNT